MELTDQQKEALSIAIDRYKRKEPYTCIAGYAGSGKTTLVRFIIAALGLKQKEVCYISYTGKAATVLESKGCTPAMTAHKLLYRSFRTKEGKYQHTPVRPIYPYKLIVVDEVSMLPKDLWDLLLSHGRPVLALGDPGQLPAITTSNGILDNPHIFLTEIMRQAAESEIISLSMAVRQGEKLAPFKGKQVQIIKRSELKDGMLLWADQIICAKNATRRQLNNRVRELIYHTKDTHPVEGDKVICLSNQWDCSNGNDEVLVNGTMGEISFLRYDETPHLKPRLLVDVLPEGKVASESIHNPYFQDLSIDLQLLLNGTPTVNANNYKTFPHGTHPIEFDYGYAITCWKSQGSEYGKVLLFDEDMPLNAEEHLKYLYTGITRAKDKLVIVMND